MCSVSESSADLIASWSVGIESRWGCGESHDETLLREGSSLSRGELPITRPSLAIGRADGSV